MARRWQRWLTVGLMGGTLALGAAPISAQGEDIAVAGSSTVFPITQRMIDTYTDGPGTGVSITHDSIGTGGGFDRLCESANADIANASRPIRDDERAACEQRGRTIVEFQVGIDALAVVVSDNNTFVEGLTLEQLAQLYSGQYDTWDELDSSWPNEPIYLYSPGTDSGTFDYFVEAVLENDPLPIVSARGIQFTESDEVLIDRVESWPYAISYFGFAYYYAARNDMRAVAIDGVEPAQASAQSGEYPLSRPLYIYTTEQALADGPAVADFVRFYLENVAGELGLDDDQVGYFPVSDETQADNLTRLDEIVN